MADFFESLFGGGTTTDTADTGGAVWDTSPLGIGLGGSTTPAATQTSPAATGGTDWWSGLVGTFGQLGGQVIGAAGNAAAGAIANDIAVRNAANPNGNTAGTATNTPLLINGQPVPQLSGGAMQLVSVAVLVLGGLFLVREVAR